MRDTEQQAVALECLRLAVAAEPMRAVETAGEFYAFVTGDDAKVPGEEWADVT